MESSETPSMKGKIRRLARNLNLDDMSVVYSTFTHTHRFLQPEPSHPQSNISYLPNSIGEKPNKDQIEAQDSPVKEKAKTPPSSTSAIHIFPSNSLEHMTRSPMHEEHSHRTPPTLRRGYIRYLLSLVVDALSVGLVNLCVMCGADLVDIFYQNKQDFNLQREAISVLDHYLKMNSEVLIVIYCISLLAYYICFDFMMGYRAGNIIYQRKKNKYEKIKSIQYVKK